MNHGQGSCITGCKLKPGEEGLTHTQRETGESSFQITPQTYLKAAFKCPSIADCIPSTSHKTLQYFQVAVSGDVGASKSIQERLWFNSFSIPG